MALSSTSSRSWCYFCPSKLLKVLGHASISISCKAMLNNTKKWERKAPSSLSNHRLDEYNAACWLMLTSEYRPNLLNIVQCSKRKTNTNTQTHTHTQKCRRSTNLSCSRHGTAVSSTRRIPLLRIFLANKFCTAKSFIHFCRCILCKPKIYCIILNKEANST